MNDPDDDDELEGAPRTRPLAAPAARAPEGFVGRSIAGRFRLLAERGRGGMSVVHEALETPLARRVAVKSALGDDPAARLRVLREAAILACLDHPAIPPVYTSGQAPGLGEYFVTRLIDGESLEAQVRRAPDAWPALLAGVADAAEAVAHAHARGIVHRDLKPAHIFVEARGTTVVDWGLARELPGRAAAVTVTITEPGTPVGTPGYWAPEQRAGGLPDPRADVYSLGAILSRLVSGREPDVAGPPLLARGPRPLRALVERATATDARARLASAAELAAALRRM